MTSLAQRLDGFDERLAALVEHHTVPGTSVAVATSEEVWTSAAGLGNAVTGTRVVPDTLFQIGSITKVMTATLVLQLVDAGKVSLDDPVRAHLPAFRLANEEAAARVTVRHLLNHTSGIHGDHFADFGRGDDAIERYVDSLVHIGQAHPVGALFSYCNAGWVVLGRLLEVVHGRTYAQVLREELLTPLGVQRAALLPEEAMVTHHAVGHVPSEDGGIRVTPQPQLSFAAAPAGSVLCLTAADLARFGRMHLDRGVAADGTRLLSASSVALMQQPSTTVPSFTGRAGMGLGWGLDGRGDDRILRHSGATIGQLSTLFCLPDQDLVVVALTNGMAGAAVSQIMIDEIAATLAGLPATPMPTPPEPRLTGLDLRGNEGVYTTLVERLTVRARDGQLEVQGAPLVEAPGVEAGPPIMLHAIDATTFCIPGQPLAAYFLEPDATGRYAYLHVGGRAARRTADLDA